MVEPLPKYGEKIELELHRSTPFEFDATTTSGSRVTTVTTTIVRPAGSWVLTEGPSQISPSMPNWIAPERIL
jgi:hypothetical protein